MEFLPIDFQDLVEGGEAQVVLPATDTGYRGYGPGRLFSVTVTGGAVTTDGDYTVHKFTADGTLECTGAIDAEFLVVAGGAGGAGGGGGAGGYLTGTETLTGSMTVTVGLGGAAGDNYSFNGNPGQDSVFGSRTAKGGGGGGRNSTNGVAGGSGGGGGWNAATTGGAATPAGQGNAGGNGTGAGNPGGGGGGAAAAGSSPADSTHGGAGGAGYNNDIVATGVNVGYAGGGGGGSASAITGGTATHGGSAGTGAAPAAANRGGGGGGGNGGLDHSGGSGGSGIVVARYPTADTLATIVYTDLVTITSEGVTAAGTNVAYSRNSSGSYYGPVVVTPAEKSAGWQTIAATLWSDQMALFGHCAVGDVVIPLGSDSLGYRKVA